jgi:hypothetical protein
LPVTSYQLPVTKGRFASFVKEKGKLFRFLFLLILMSSCQKENQIDSGLSNNGESPIQYRDPSNPPMVPGETILGDQLQNPYDINNMENAYAALTGSTIQFSPTHYYIKFSPVDGEDIIEIETFEEEYGYEFETQPIHFEVLAEGKEDYVDPIVGDGGFSPEYGAVTLADFTGGHFPNVPYVVLNGMYIPIYETRLTFTAFVISGNEQYYEAIDGLCHPDCPSWPDCLDDASLTCQVGSTVGYMPTIDPMATQPRENFPGYILDEDLGYYGEIDETSSRIPIIPDELDCPEGCIPILEVAPISLGGWFWDCDCPDDWDDDGGIGPPAGQVTRCGCFVYDDKRMPGGRLSVTDTQFPEDEGVRKVKVMTAPRYFGFIWHNTNTDDNGCWKIDNRYNVKNLKIKAVFKDRVSERMVIRGMRGIRLWNAFLKPVKHKFVETRSNKEWHSLCLIIADDTDNDSRDEQSYMAALTNNSIHEYYDDFSSMPSPGKIKVLIHNWGDHLDAAPMFSEIDQDQFTFSDISGFFLAFDFPYVQPLTTLWDWSKPDLFLSFGDNNPSDQKRSTVYHEMTHASQYAMAGPVWWEEYVRYIIRVGLLQDQPKPYGDGSVFGAGRAELAEGMAYAHEWVVADQKYGLDHSNGGLDPQIRRYLSLAEDLLFHEASSSFIPSGLFFDLYDDNGVFPPVTPALTELPGISDQAKGFPFENQVQILQLPFVLSIPSYKSNLWDAQGTASGSTLLNYESLFSSYGH